MADKYDFSGYVTRTNIKCSDGRTIKPNAFADQDGAVVPLIYNHNHEDMHQVVGHIKLENRADGVYGYGKFNDTESGQLAHSLVSNGDIRSLSIFANQLTPRRSPIVEHGLIREVSLVLAGANPGAFIDNPTIAHSDGTYTELEDEADIYMGEENTLINSLTHADKTEASEGKEENKVADNKERTIGDVYNAMTDEQKKVVQYLVAKAAEGTDDDSDENEDDEEEEETVKHNAFSDGFEEDTKDYISHSDQEAIINMAKNTGNELSFQDALRKYVEENTSLSHADAADAVAGFDNTNKVWDGKTSLELMFPEYREAKAGMPQILRNDQGWISVVLNGVKKAPYSRVRTTQIDIRKLDNLRARGYKKGAEKKLNGQYSLIRRTTDPQTVYARSTLNNDDINDITDFDYLAYQYNEIDRPQLDEEVATAIMIGDGREDSDPDKIFPDHIRPIWTDDDLYVKHIDVDIAAAKKAIQGSDTSVHFSDNYIYAEAILEAVLHGKESDWFGNGTSDMFCTPHLANQMMLARDFNGRRIYDNRRDLAAAMDIGTIYTAEQFNGKIRTDSKGKKHKLLAIIGNLTDYQVGSTKGGQISHFTNFDLRFNQHQSLIETRLSGAVITPYSFIVLEEPVEDSASAGTGVGA